MLLLSNGKKKYSAKDLIKNVLEKPELISDIPKNALKRKISFRVIASEENQLVPIERNLLKKIETQLANKLGLKVDRSLPDLEVWFLTRIVAGKWDALNLSSLANTSIDKIITDPPWGFFGNTGVNLKKFYKDMALWSPEKNQQFM